jgi:hypothetical protein
MTSFLTENMTIVRHRWPIVANILEESSSRLTGRVVQDGRQSTLLIEGIHLSSSYDRMAEAALQASLIPEDATEAWVYGIGLGDLPRCLLRRSRLRRLHLVLLNPAVARQSFESYPHRDWMTDDRVEILTASGQDQLQFPFTAVVSCLQLAGEASARLRDQVVLELATPFIRKRHAADDLEQQVRLKENEPLVAADGDVAELFGSCSRATVLVAGAGPTLGEHFERLRHRKMPLIAVDAALKPLTEAGVVPEVVVTLDAKKQAIERFFREADLELCRTSTLVYFPMVHPAALSLWPGRRLAAFSSAPVYAQMRQSLVKGELFSSGSVLHPAVDLAVRMGAARIVLLGADFGYPGGRSHVSGCAVARPVAVSRAHILDGRGNAIGTASNLRGYLRDLENYIACHPQVTFINGSLSGARIEGTRVLEQLDDF